MGQQSVVNLIGSINASRTRPLEKVIFSLGIPLVGARTARDLALRYDNIVKLSEATLEELERIEGIGRATAEGIFGWFKEKSNVEMVLALIGKIDAVNKISTFQDSADVLFGEVKVDSLTIEKVPLEGKTIVVTGKMVRMTREEVEALVFKLGGKPVGSVSAKTSMVIAGPGAGSKLSKANDLNIKVLTEDEFLNEIGISLEPEPKDALF